MFNKLNADFGVYLMYKVILKKTDFQQILLPYFLFYSLASLPGKNSCTKSYSFWQQIFCCSGTSSNPVNTGKHLHETCMYLSYSYMYAFWLKYLSQLREVQILRQFIQHMLHFFYFQIHLLNVIKMSMGKIYSKEK